MTISYDKLWKLLIDCEANGYDAEKIGQHFLEILPKICPPEER